MALTAQGWPYPLPAEFVRDGSAAIQALATEADKRIGAGSVVGQRVSMAFNVNGSYYLNWNAFAGGVSWLSPPVVWLTAETAATGGDAGVHLQINSNTTATLLITGFYVKDGRTFASQTINVNVLAVGRKA